MTLVPINEFDIVFISYDEPNADEHWYNLQEKCPWAKRSHGVWGSDAAHKAAARLCETDRIITVDADNVVDPEFFNLEIDLELINRDDVISWAAKNEINGLVYGNGGIKCWPKHVIEQMRTHEAAPQNDLRAQVDFCWNINYVQMNNIYSHVYNNGSPLQAWRAGFREGVKMTLEGGKTVEKSQIKKIHRKNYQRLLVWQSVGLDVQNGIWAIYGSRLGCMMTNLRQTTWNWHNVRDFDWLNNFWHDEIAPKFQVDDITQDAEICERTGYSWNYDVLLEETRKIGAELRHEIDLEFADLDESGSRFFKEVYINPARVHPMARETQVINEIGK